MSYQPHRFVIVVAVLLATVSVPPSPLAAASAKTSDPGQLQQQLRQMQSQQSQLRTNVEELNKQLGDVRNRMENTPAPRVPSWAEQYLPVTVSIIAAILSAVFFYKSRQLNKEIDQRTVTIEAQKLLLEINKQYLSNPALFAIYDKREGSQELLKNDSELKEKIKALGYMKLNIFELVYDVLPDAEPWRKYFEDSLDRCEVLRLELEAELETGLYNKKLIAAYKAWVKGKVGAERKKAAPNPTVTPPQTTPATPPPHEGKGEG